MKTRLLLGAVLLAGCAPKTATDGTGQTLQAGVIRVTISAPAWVTAQAFYPVKVTYTNTGKEAVNYADPFHCSWLWNVEDANSGQVPNPPRRAAYGCVASTAPIKTLAPGESQAGTFNAIIDGYSPGQYRLPARQLQGLRPVLYLAGSKWDRPEFSPAAQDIRFEIR